MEDSPRLLVTKIAQQHAVKVPQLQFISDDPTGVEITELTGGQVNHVFRVRSRDGQSSVVIKHAESRVKNVSELTLPRDRVVVEFNGLQWFNKIVEGFCPRPYCVDMTSYTVVMEDLNEMRSLQAELYDGHVDVPAARHLAVSLATIHSATYLDSMEPDQRLELMECFSKEEMKNAKGDFSYGRALEETQEANRFNSSTVIPFRETVENGILREYFSQCSELYRITRECLIHGDLHQLSIFNRNGRSSVLDMECCCLGRRMYDLGCLLCAYSQFYYYSWEKGRVDVMRQLRELCTLICDTYQSTCSAGGVKLERGWIPELAAFTTCFLFRCMYAIGIEDFVKLQPETSRVVMEQSMRCLSVHEQLSTVHEFVDLLLPENITPSS